MRHATGSNLSDDYPSPLNQPTPAGAAPRDEARDLDQMLKATAHWPPLTDDQLQMLAAYGPLSSIAAMEILRLRAAAPRADPTKDDTALLWEIWAVATRLNTLGLSDAGRLERIERMVEKAWEPAAARAPGRAE